MAQKLHGIAHVLHMYCTCIAHAWHYHYIFVPYGIAHVWLQGQQTDRQTQTDAYTDTHTYNTHNPHSQTHTQ